MNDQTDSEAARTKAALIEKLSALSDADLAKKASNLIQRLEASYSVIIGRMDNASENDRNGVYAEASLVMASLLHDIESVHAKASIVEGKVTGQPMTRGGDR